MTNLRNMKVRANSQFAKFNVGSKVYHWEGYYIERDTIRKVLEDEQGNVYYLFDNGNYIPSDYAMTYFEAEDSKEEMKRRKPNYCEYNDIDLPF